MPVANASINVTRMIEARRKQERTVMIDPRKKDWTEKDWAEYDLLMEKAWNDVFEEREALRDNEEGETQMTGKDKIKIYEEMELYPQEDTCVEKTEKAPCDCQDTSDSEDVTAWSWLKVAKETSEKKKEEKKTMDAHEKNLKHLEMQALDALDFLADRDGDRITWDDVFRKWCIKKHREMMEKSYSSQDIPSEDVMVHHPPHYVKDNGLECIEWIKLMLTPEEFRGYLKGCACKYLWRHDKKGNRQQDLQKAQWYLKYLEDC